MFAIRAALSGYKTYIVALVMVLGVFVEVFLGMDIPGFTPGNDWLMYLLNGLGLGTLRAGIGKAVLGKVF